jgi:hypothetical protein
MIPKTPLKSVDSSPSPGDLLVEAITSTYILNPAELVLLDRAAALVDVLARLEEQIAAKKTLTQRGAKGNSVVSPLLLAQRRHSEVLTKLLNELSLPAVDEDEGDDPASRRARKAALARWSKARS